MGTCPRLEMPENPKCIQMAQNKMGNMEINCFGCFGTSNFFWPIHIAGSESKRNLQVDPQLWLQICLRAGGEPHSCVFEEGLEYPFLVSSALQMHYCCQWHVAMVLTSAHHRALKNGHHLFQICCWDWWLKFWGRQAATVSHMGMAKQTTPNILKCWRYSCIVVYYSTGS